jgi:hypothetical protein
VLGPKIFNHAICSNCGTGYNAKSGKPNLVPIVLYVAVTAVLGVVLILSIR